MYYLNIFKQFKNENYQPVYLFYGKEKYLIDHLIEYLKKEKINQAYWDFNLHVHDYNKVSIHEILEKSQTLPFMGDYTFNIVTNCDLFTEKLDKKEEASLEKYCKSPNETNVLIFISDKVDKRKKSYKLVSKVAEVMEFRKLNNKELFKWLKKYISDQGNQISRSNISFLMNQFGYLDKTSKKELYEITQELNKMTSFAPAEEITRDIILKFIEKPIEENIFELLNAIVECRSQDALDVLNVLIESGEPVLKILFMIIRQFRNIYKVKLLSEVGLSYHEASKVIKIHKYGAKKASEYGRTLSKKKLKKIMDSSVSLDLKLKSSSVDSLVLLNKYIADIIFLIKS